MLPDGQDTKIAGKYAGDDDTLMSYVLHGVVEYL